MNRRKRILTHVILITVALLCGAVSGAWSQNNGQDKPPKFKGKVTPAERKAAAGRAAALGLQPGVAALNVAIPAPGAIDGPGGIPHYFGPYGNWAYSPLPKGPVTAVLVGGTGYTVAPAITISDAYGTNADVVVPAGNISLVNGAVIVAVPLGGYGSTFTAPVVTITGGDGTGATPTASITPAAGTGMQKFVDYLPGIPGVTSYNTGPGYNASGANNLGQYMPLAVAETIQYKGQAAEYYEIALVEYQEKMHSALPPTRQRGYVQLSTAAVPGKQIPLVNPDTSIIYMPDGTTQAVAVDNPHFLGPIILAHGRAQGVAGAAGNPTPVIIRFYNLLPKGPVDPTTGRRPGDLFLPVDETVMGSGLGPALPGTAGDKYTQNRATIHLHGNNTVWLSDGNVHQWITPANESTPYPAGVSARNVPDMPGCASDPTKPLEPGSSGCMTFFYTNAQGARLQFYHDHAMGITRLNVYAGEAAGYVITDAVDQDMMNGTNASGINGINPNGVPIPGTYKKVLPDYGIPLVIQDRTWVDASTIFAQDPTWNWGTGSRYPIVPGDPKSGLIQNAVTGDYWYPHVYMSAQNPWDLAGTNAFGRWHYGPWFNPPVPECVNGGPVGCIELGPVPNEYYQPVCDGLPDPVNPVCTAPWEPPMRPGVPNPSIPGEGFMDTPTVNGTAYPVLKLEPKAYRFRILNAANDRMLNLQLYKAADKSSWTPGTGSANPGTPTALCPLSPVDPTVCTEVKMISANGAPNQYADWPSGIPDPTTTGPDWWLIGTEGGFVPAPVVVPQLPVGWNLNPTTFNFGNVNQHSLLLGSAERADVVVDFSAYPGQTFILYNDAPAAFPAGVPVYDYFTGVPDQLGTGGAPTTQPGYGPNTRTIMQIQIAGTATAPLTPDVTLANLQAVFAKTAGKRGVFEVSQDPIIIPQAAYNLAYGATFPTTAAEQYVQIADTAKTFKPIQYNAGTGNWDTLAPVTLPLEMKAMHDEMGGVYDTQFGRMSGMLGLTNPTSPVHVLIPYGLASPPTDLVAGSVEANPVSVFPDGTQIWRIFHNGVDTHTIHTHLFHSQLINRLGQDGINLEVDPIELGWKDTFRVNPLEVTYLAMRPTIPTQAQLPFEPPDSTRLIDPTLPEGATLIPPPPAGWFDPAGVGIASILNHTVNFGWEYVWHCHILAHEEMDMMHSLVFAVPPMAPTGLVATLGGTANNPRVNLNWTDNSKKEAKYLIQRATDANFSVGLTTIDPKLNTTATTGLVAYQDASVAKDTKYWYRVFAIGNLVGDAQAYPAPSVGFPTMSVNSVSINPPSYGIQVGNAAQAPPAPSNLARTLQAGPQVSLTWRDNATNETGFVVERCTGANCGQVLTNFAQIATVGPRNNTGSVTYVDATVKYGNSYSYRVGAVNVGGTTYCINPATVSVSVPAIPPAPTGFTVIATKANGNNYTAALNWTYTPPPAPATNPLANFTIQRAEDLGFTVNLNTATVAGNVTTVNQTVTKNTVYYYRIRSNNIIGGSSAWTNAQPFPIRTGP